MARPFKFNNAGELEALIESYFSSTPENDWTVTGLCLVLECDRDTLLNYEREANIREEKGVDEDIIRLIKKARMRVHNAYERDLRKKGRSGDIFALKNFGWKDQQHVDATTNGKDIPTPILATLPKSE